jgi:ribosomal protein L11 methyltransferase
MTVRRIVLAAPEHEDEDAFLLRVLDAFPGGVEEERDADGRLLVAAYAEGGEALPSGFDPSSVADVPEGWEDAWKAFHSGRPVADRLWVGPPWEDPPPGLLSVVIDPGRAFGTGSHPSTLLTLELLCGIDPTGPVLDLGCGSGVLSVAAGKLGFSPLLACDIDPIGVESTVLNGEANGVTVKAFEADARSDPLPRAELWLANILQRPLEAILARDDAAPRAIVSGLLATEPLDAPAYEVTEQALRDGWQALLLTRR